MNSTIKVMLQFPPESADQPVTYRLVKDFDVAFNIINAEVTHGKRGRLTLELIGENENIEKSLAFLAEQGIKCKIFSKVMIWNEDECIHCGTCTSVCPSGALSLDQKTWKITFNQDKCLVCELCTKTCPLRVMDVDLFL